MDHLYNILIALVMAASGVRMIMSPEKYVDRRGHKHTKESQIKYAKFCGVMSILMGVICIVFCFVDTQGLTLPLIGTLDTVYKQLIVLVGGIILLCIIAYVIGYAVIIKKADGEEAEADNEDEEF